jgi:hypothetical protein
MSYWILCEFSIWHMILKYTLVSHTVASFLSSFTVPVKQHKFRLEITAFSELLCSFTRAAGVTYITAAIRGAEFFQPGHFVVLFARFFACFVFYLKKCFSLAQICLKLSLKFLLRYWLNNIHCHFYYQNVFIGPNVCYVSCRKQFIHTKRTHS